MSRKYTDEAEDSSDNPSNEKWSVASRVTENGEKDATDKECHRPVNLAVAVG